ncbi:O-acetyltransferase WecH [uncultured archaeon]|nr:O-acetyltransferase WecH [uncultured archaeon]
MVSIPITGAGLEDAGASVLLLLLVFFLGDEWRAVRGEQAGHKKETPPLQQRLGFFDFLKGVAMLAVVGIHTVGVVGAGEELNALLWAALPLFVIASGYLLMRRYGERPEWGRYFESLFWRVVVPYAVYTIIWSLLRYGADLPQIVLDLLLGRERNGELYFIPLLVQLYLLFPLMQRLRRLLFHPLVMGVVAAISFAIFYWRENSIGDSFGHDILLTVFCGRYLFYFLAGAWLSDREFGLAPSWKTWAAALVWMGWQVGAQDWMGFAWTRLVVYPFGIFLLLSMAYGLLRTRAWTGPLLGLMEGMGRESLAIYMLHPLVLYGLFAPLVGMVSWPWPLEYGLVAVLGALISYAVGGQVMKAYRHAVQKYWHERRAKDAARAIV